MAFPDVTHAKAVIRSRFPWAVRVYKRRVAPRLARDKRPYELAAWASHGLALRRRVGFRAITLDGDGFWVQDADGLWWSYTPGVFMSAVGAEFGLTHERAGIETVDGWLGTGGLFVDVGANVGTYAMTLAARRPDIEIHAFEPISTTRAVLERNLARNGLAGERMHVWPVAASSEAGEARMTASLNVCNHLLPPGVQGAAESHERVTTVVLDEFLAGRDRPVSVLKCDVEGAEIAVLEGAAGILEADRPHVLVEIEPTLWARFGHDPLEAFAFFDQRGYAYARIVGDEVRAAGPSPDHDLAEGTNFLFSPRAG